MATLIEQLQALLTPLAAGRSHYQVNEDKQPVLPYITFGFVGGDPQVTLDGASDLQNYRLQVDVFSARVSEAQSVGKAVQNTLAAALDDGTLNAVPIGQPQDIQEEAVGLRRRMLEFSVWSRDG